MENSVMKVTHKTLIAASLASFAAGIVIGNRFDSCLQAIKAIDTKFAGALPSSLRNVRWLFPAGAIIVATGVTYFLKGEVDPLIQAVNNGTKEFEDAFFEAIDDENMKAAEILLNLALQQELFDVNNADDDGTTVLVWAAEEGLVGIVKISLAHGADTTAIGNGKTALQWAQQNGHMEIVEMLNNHKS